MKSIVKLTLIAFLLAACSKSSTSYVNNPNAPDYLHNRPVGASANEILASSKYSSLKIEIQYMTGFAPDPGAISHLQAFLSGLINKPGGVTIVTKEIPVSSNTTLSVNDVLSTERNNRTAFTNGS